MLCSTNGRPDKNDHTLTKGTVGPSFTVCPRLLARDCTFAEFRAARVLCCQLLVWLNRMFSCKARQPITCRRTKTALVLTRCWARPVSRNLSGSREAKERNHECTDASLTNTTFLASCYCRKAHPDVKHFQRMVGCTLSCGGMALFSGSSHQKLD